MRLAQTDQQAIGPKAKAKPARVFSFPGQQPDIGHIQTPRQHLEMLWPGLSIGQPFYSKSLFTLPDGLSNDTEKRMGKNRGLAKPVTVQERMLYVQHRNANKGLQYLDQILADEVQGQFRKFISVNLFGKDRKAENLKAYVANFIDLDLNKAKRFKSAYDLQEAAIEHLLELGIPRPNVVVYSGGGCHLYWCYQRMLPSKAGKVWQAVQKHLVGQLSSFGADPAARDPSRVLRIVGTKHEKYRQIIEGEHHNWVVRAQTLVPKRIDFNEFAESVLPIAPRMYAYIREQQLEKKLLKAQSRDQLKTGEVIPFPVRRIPITFNETNAQRLADIERIVQAVWPSGVEQGYRDQVSFHACVAMAWMFPADQLMERTLNWCNQHKVAIEAGGAYLGSAIERAKKTQKMIQEGLIVSHALDFRYKYTAERLWLEFSAVVENAPDTKELQKSLKAIISEDTRAERRKQAKRLTYARDNEQVDSYTGRGCKTSNLSDFNEAHRLAAQGLRQAMIAKQLHKSTATISKWLKKLALVANNPQHIPPEAATPSPVKALPKSATNNIFDVYSQGGLKIGSSGLKRGVRGDFQPVDNFSLPSASTSMVSDATLQIAKAEPAPVSSPAHTNSTQNRSMKIVSSTKTQPPPQKPQQKQESISFVTAPERITEEFLAWARSLTPQETFDKIGLYYKVNSEFKTNTAGEVQLYVQPDGHRMYVLNCNGVKWTDHSTGVGKGGAIDLLMYIYGVKFYRAIQMIQNNII